MAKHLWLRLHQNERHHIQASSQLIEQEGFVKFKTDKELLLKGYEKFVQISKKKTRMQ